MDVPGLPDLTVEVVEGVTVATLRPAHVHAADADRIAVQLRAVVPATGRLVLDLSAVAFLTSALVGAVVDVNRACHDRGGRLVVCGCRREVLDVFQPLPARQRFNPNQPGPLFAATRAAAVVAGVEG